MKGWGTLAEQLCFLIKETEVAIVAFLFPLELKVNVMTGATVTIL